MLLVVHQKSLRRIVEAVAAALFLWSAGCGGETQTRVEQGQPVATGNADFDSFFKEVEALRQASSKAVSEADMLASPLAKSLGIAGSARAFEALVPLSERARKWRASGFRPRLSLLPKPEVERRAKAEPSDDEVLNAVEASAQDALSLVDRMRELERRASDMRVKARELKARAQVTFGSKADEIESELGAATAVLERAAELSAVQGGRASYFVVGMMSALEREAGAASPAPSKAALASQEKAPARPPSAGRKPPPSKAPAAPPAAPPPKPAGKPSSDFDP